MNFFIKTKGSVSVFLVIIMVPVIVVCTVFIDVSRIKLAQGLAASSADLALNSMLTQYDTELSDYYGLMASCQDIESFYDVAEGYFEFCMVSQGISVSDAQKWSSSIMDVVAGESDINDLLQIDTENTQASIEPVENATLANPVMMKEEIIEFMKYRAPVELIGAMDSGNGFVSKLTSVKDSIEILPDETRIQKEKVAYYNAENELLKKALVIYEILSEYESIQYDGNQYLDDAYLERIQKDMKSESVTDKGLEETYKELHAKYVSYWENTEGYTTGFVSVESYVSAHGNRSISDGEKNAQTIRDAITECSNKRKAYETAKDNMALKLQSISFAKPDPARQVNEVQYWVQMDKAMGDTYDNYVKAQAEFATALRNMEYAYDNREEGKREVPVTDDEGNVVYDSITGEQMYEEETYDIGEDSYDGNISISSAYSSEKSSSDNIWNARTGEYIYDISKNIETYSEEAVGKKLTDRTEAEREIAEAVKTLREEYELITGAQEILEEIVEQLPKLLELANQYHAAFDTWSGDVQNHTGRGSSLIDNDKKEVDIINGNVPADGADIATEGLVPVDIDEQEVKDFQTRLQNTIELLQSYRDTIESIRYRGTTIVGERVTEKVQTSDDGINTFELFEDAAMTQRNGCAAETVKEGSIPVYQDDLDAYIEKTWEITDEIDSLVAVTHDNSPKLHDYDGWKGEANPDIDHFDAWLHKRFDDIEKTSAEVDDLLKKLKEMIKNFGDSVLNDFGSYNNPYLSDNPYRDISNLPSKGVSDPIKETDGEDVSESEDVTKDLESSSSVAGLFERFDFGKLLESGRDNLYATEYIMGMFTYETQALECVYEQAREGAPENDIYKVKKDGTVIDIGPRNADQLYESALREGGTWWTDKDKTHTYNKSLTNKMLDKTNNYSFGNEVEYIMFGGDIDSSKERMNTTIYFIRYALDLTPVMSEYWTDKTVTSIASTISGATAGVVPIPLIKAVICLGICAAEAAVDLNYLKAGLPVLFIKGGDELFIKLSLDKDSFPNAVKDGTAYMGKTFEKNDISIAKKETDSNSGLGLLFSYSDYLRIFLYIQLCVSEDNVYLRTADVIQANMSKNVELPEYMDNFEMEKALTCFQITADVRVKPLMLRLPYAQQMEADALDTDSWNTFTTDTTIRGY